MIKLAAAAAAKRGGEIRDTEVLEGDTVDLSLAVVEW